jgi:hypothetical protein
VIWGVLVVAVGGAVVLGAAIWTFAQRMARRARERADGIVARDGIAAERSYSVNLLGSTALARAAIRGVGVLALTPATVEFRLGYGSTALSIPRSALVAVGVGAEFRMQGRRRRFVRPVVLTLRWIDADGVERLAGFATRQAAEIRDHLT